MTFNKEELLEILVKKGEIQEKDKNFEFDSEVDFFKKLISLSPKSFKFFPYEYKNNYEIVFEAIKKHGDNYSYASEKMKNNKELIISLSRDKDSCIHEGFLSEIINDKKVALELAKSGSDLSMNLDVNYLDDKEIVLDSIKYFPETFKYVSRRLKNDPEVLKTALLYGGYRLFNYASEELKKDEKFIIDFINYESNEKYNKNLNLKNKKFDDVEPKILNYISTKLKDNERFIKKMLFEPSNNVFNEKNVFLSFASDKIQKNRRLIIKLVRKKFNWLKNENHKGSWSDLNLDFIRFSLRDNDKFIKDISKYNLEYLSLASDRLLSNKEFVLSCIENIELKEDNFKAIDIYSNLPKDLQNDLEIIYSLIKKSIKTQLLESIPVKLKTKEFLINFYKNTGKSWVNLQCFSNEIRSDFDLLLNLINSGVCFSFSMVVDELKNNKEFIIKSFEKGIYDYESISDKLKEDKEIKNLFLNKGLL